MNYKELFKNKKFRWLIATLLIIVLPFEILSLASIHLPYWIRIFLLCLIIMVFGRKLFTSGFSGLFKLEFSNINLLMTISTVGAIYLQHFEEAVIIIVLFALGEELEEFGIARSQAALKNLVDKTPKSAQIKNKEEKIPIENVEVGEIIIVKPGDQIPLDGEIISGASLLDETVITGEPLPRSKYIGDFVYAGTFNGDGYLEIKVTKKAQDTTLAKIIDLTYKSSEKKSTSQKFIEKFAKFYTPSVVFLAVFLVVIPVIFLRQSFDIWFIRSLTILLIACPCALVISTPVTIFSSLGNATQKGVLIKGGRFIEAMGKIKVIAFDKTRTLTKGEPVVSDIVPFNSFTEEDVIACAAGMEVCSNHPIAKSILTAANTKCLPLHQFENFQSVLGKGLKGECAVCLDKHHCLGSIRFVTEEHHAEEIVLKKVDEFEKQGKTTIVMSSDKKIKGVIGVIDEIREESKTLINSLLKLQIMPVVLTGDNKSSAEFVSKQLGIKNVKAELLPEGKVEELLKLIKQYRYVAMIGDGVNDAPAIAAASVGIVMGAVGSDVAIENADIALMNDNLGMVSYLINLGRKCVATIRFNIALAVLVKFSFLFLSIAGWSSLSLAIFADVGVTVLVILNSLRLYNYKGDVG